MNRRLCTPGRRRRAVSLICIIVLLPLTLVLIALMLTELQVRKFETRRNELRVQSRLLVESGLALAATLPAPPAEPINSKIDGAGSYRIERTHLADGRFAFRVSGMAGRPRYQVVTQVDALAAAGGRLTILSTGLHALSGTDPDERPVYDGPTTNGWSKLLEQSQKPAEETDDFEEYMEKQ